MHEGVGGQCSRARRESAGPLHHPSPGWDGSKHRCSLTKQEWGGDLVESGGLGRAGGAQGAMWLKHVVGGVPVARRETGGGSPTADRER